MWKKIISFICGVCPYSWGKKRCYLYNPNCKVCNSRLNYVDYCGEWKRKNKTKE